MDRVRLQPLGDQAVLIYCADERAAARLAAAVRAAAFPWCEDVVQAYTSVAVFYRLSDITFVKAAAALDGLDGVAAGPPTDTRLHLVPCCYELALDLERVTAATGLSSQQVIDLHLTTVYTVYAIGFCPGFPYLGYLPVELSGVPRLETPRIRIEAGSVGLTGRQTGIYTEARPGGWNIIGRTPLELVNVADGYFPLRTGDRVQFRRIDDGEFRRLSGQRL